MEISQHYLIHSLPWLSLHELGGTDSVPENNIGYWLIHLNYV